MSILNTGTQAVQKLNLSIPSGFSVNPTTGALENLSLITGDREALGHGIFIDQDTIATGEDCVKGCGGVMRAYVTHNHGGAGGGWWQPDGDEFSSELNMCGFFADISVKGNQLVAGRFEWYDAFKRNFKTQYEQLLEVAQKTPTLMGLSIEPWGYSVYVAEDGTEYTGIPDGVKLKYDGMPALRITALSAAAFVAEPAANDGLFAKFKRKMGLKSKPAPAAKPEVDEIQPTTEPQQFSHMTIIQSIKAEFGADKAKFSQAMTLLGENPEITIEALKAQMATVELSALKSEVVSLSAKVTELETANKKLAEELAASKQEVVAEKAKFAAAKESGFSGQLNLGATSAGAGDVNPWHPDHRNLSKQAEILKANPEQAKALQAAVAGLKPTPKTVKK